MELLVEREREVSALEGLLRRAGDGDGGAIFVEGESGAGKTRLLALAGEAAAGMQVLRAVADDEETDVPLAAARVLLARAAAARLRAGDEWLATGLARSGALALTGDTGDAVGDEEVVHGIYWFVVALADLQPLALVVDDAHWADSLSLRCLRLIARRAHDLPLALVVAGRPPARNASRAYHALLAERGLERLEPAALSEGGVAQVVERLFGRPGGPGFVAAAHAAARGNPLLVGELLRGLAERGVEPVDALAGDLARLAPESLARFAAARLSGLDPAAAQVCRACAVLGPDATPQRVAFVARTGAEETWDALGRLAESRILAPLAPRDSLGGVGEPRFAAPADVAPRDSLGGVGEPRFAAPADVAPRDALGGLAEPRVLAPAAGSGRLAERGIAFLHPVFATAVRAALPADLAGELHARAGEALRADGAPVERVVAHLVHAAPRGDPAVVELLAEAARGALRVGAAGRAAAWLERALAEPPEPDRAAELEAELGAALLDAGNAAGEEILVRAIRADRGGDEALRRLVTYYAFAGRFGDALELVAARHGTEPETRRELLAEALHAGSGDPRLRERVRELLASSAPPAGDTPAARGAPPAGDSPAARGAPPAGDSPAARGAPPAGDSPAARGAPPAGDSPAARGAPPAGDSPAARGAPSAEDTPAARGAPPAGDTPAAGLLGAVQHVRELLESSAPPAHDTPAARLLRAVQHVPEGGRAEEVAAAAGRVLAQRLHFDFPRSFAAGGLTMRAVADLINADRLDDAREAMEAVRADARAARAIVIEGGAVWSLAQIAYQAGELARAELDVRACLSMPFGPVVRVALPVLVLVLAETGELDEAEHILTEAGMVGALPVNPMTTAVHGARGRLRLAQERFADAAADLRVAHERNLAFWGRPRHEPPWRALLVHALVASGERKAAAAEAAALEATAREWGTARALGVALRARAAAAAPAEALPWLEQACALLARSHGRLEQARALADLGARRQRAGQRVAARAALRDAHELASRCGAKALCDTIRAELLVAGGRPRAAQETGAESLTAGERRVADLAAAGASNRTIAQRLYLSPKTVEMHLSHAYRKLGVDGRRGLAAVIAG